MDKTAILTVSLFFYDLGAKRLIRIYDGMIFGRNGGNEQFPDDRQVSREHFKVTILGTEVFIEDLRSSNKTQINGQAILPGKPTPLKFNDVIEFGSQRLVFTSDANYSDKLANASTERQVLPRPSARPASGIAGMLGMKARLWPHQRFAGFVSKFVHFEGWEWSTVFFVFMGLVLTICVFVSVKEALRPGLAFSMLRIGLKILVAYFVATFVGAFVNYSLVHLRKTSWYGRPVFWLPAALTLLLALFGMQWLTAYPNELTANQITYDCLSAFDAEKCSRGVKFNPQGYSRIPIELQAQITARLGQ